MTRAAGVDTITDPQTLRALAEYYIEECKFEEKPPTYSGLMRALGVTGRKTLWKIAAQSEAWHEAVEYAKLLVAESYEKDLRGQNASGPIFALKNLGWTDKQEIDHTSSDGSLQSVQVDPETVTALVDKLLE